MFRRADTLAGIGALAFHAGVAAVIISVPPPAAHSSTTVEVEIRQPPPPPKPPDPITPPKPEEPPPERKVIEKVRTAPAPLPSPAPPSNEPPPKEPVKPVYEMKEVLEGGDSNVTVQQGNNGNILANPNANPKGPSKPMPGGNGTGAPTNEYRPVGDLYIKRQPEIDTDACARFVQYPAEAQELGIDGAVELKVSLDETGKVHDIRVLKGLGHGLEEAAVHALKYKCHFSPAIGTDGKPAAYVINKYVWTFELPR